MEMDSTKQQAKENDDLGKKKSIMVNGAEANVIEGGKPRHFIVNRVGLKPKDIYYKGGLEEFAKWSPFSTKAVGSMESWSTVVDGR
ncbi:uncharacterized protein ChrSV_p0018 (plasmid) [Chromobacterium vaccinii]|nr:uncharacterized protein ChrSW_p0018 [Chromobacterium vaccinii]QND87436.1 uncharacterized protein ChrSV_p0018 [Chromobacterium vaccinii]